jgi:hypothetical protein
MENFKGTKGKWAVLQTDEVESHLDIAINTEREDCVCWVYSKFDYQDFNGKANALLISKAPEMLEMLEKLEPIFRELNVVGLANEIEQLIKEATEI